MLYRCLLGGAKGTRRSQGEPGRPRRSQEEEDEAIYMVSLKAAVFSLDLWLQVGLGSFEGAFGFVNSSGPFDLWIQVGPWICGDKWALGFMYSSGPLEKTFRWGCAAKHTRDVLEKAGCFRFPFFCCLVNFRKRNHLYIQNPECPFFAEEVFWGALGFARLGKSIHRVRGSFHL